MTQWPFPSVPKAVRAFWRSFIPILFMMTTLAFPPSSNGGDCPPEAVRFSDVPPGSSYYSFVNTLVWHGITGGCQIGAYCPGSTVTRAQMSVYLLMARYSSTFVPPPAVGLFNDLGGGYAPFGPFIERAYLEGIMPDCGGGSFCPGTAVTRGDMAQFLLRAEEGSSYVPPACNGASDFSDVPASDPLCPWVKELVNRGITSGCGGGKYCPGNANTRGEMAVFLTTTFHLPMPSNSPYGVVSSGGLANDPDMQKEIVELGAGWVRANLPWDHMERVKGTIDWSEADKLVNSLEARGGIYLFWDFSYAPCWANDQPCLPDGSTAYASSLYPVSPAHLPDLRNFVMQVVRRYAGRNIYWGGWNEANSTDFYKGSFSAYLANEFPTIINAIKDADGSAKIVLGELHSAQPITNVMPSLQSLLAASPQPFDAISQHIYDGGNTCSGRVANIDTVRSNLVTWGYGSKPLWITESGIDAPEASKSKHLQCLYSAMKTRSWWSKTFWYRYEPETGPNGNTGLTDATSTGNCSTDPNRSFGAFQALAKGTLDDRFDVDKSSYPDLVIRHNSLGSNASWELRRGVYAGSLDLPVNGDLTWSIVGTADFNADGSSDLLWRNQSGDNWVWLMNGASYVSDFHLPVLAQPWQIGGTADFNLDGWPDIAWHNPTTKANQVWFWSGANVSTGTVSTNTLPGMRMVGVGFFNDDGSPDVVWRDDSTGATQIWLMDSTTRIGIASLSNQPDSTWRLVATADLNKDLSTDFVWRRTSGEIEAWLMSGTTRTAVVALPPLDTQWSIVGPK